MRTAQWTFVTFLTALLLLAGIRLTAGSGRSQDPRKPDRGRLAPVLDPPPRKIPLARFPDTPGPLLDLDTDGERIAVLARNGWAVHPTESGPAWHGGETAGSPDWLSRPESIALSGRTVYVLEPGRSIISVWDISGRRTGEIVIPVRRDLAQRGTSLVVGPSGRPVVVLQGMDQDGTAWWEIVELNPSGVVTGAVSIPTTENTAIFQEPKVAVRDVALLAMSSLSQELWAVDLAGNALHPVASRVDPPIWLLPPREQRKHEELLGRMPPAMAAVARLPDYWPPVREFTVREDGSIIQSTASGEASIQIELLTIGLEGLGRASLDGFPEPVFLAGGRAFVIEEETDGTVVYEILF